MSIYYDKNKNMTHWVEQKYTQHTNWQMDMAKEISKKFESVFEEDSW